MTDNTNTTAAQPLDLAALDKLEALARAADQGEGQHVYTHPRDSNKWQENANWHYAASPEVFLSLIAQARAAQPAELTDACKAQARADFEALARRNGGAHVNLARFPEDDMFRAGRYVDSMIQDQWIGYSARASQPESATGTTGAIVRPWQERMAEQRFAYPERDHMLAEIADLRAQLAARGRVNVKFDLTDYSKPVIYSNRADSTACEGTRPKFYPLSTPASAQPDRGAAQVPDAFAWPEPPPSKGQSHVLFEDGYAEGWAKAIDTVRSRLAAAPSSASKPVAPEAAHAQQEAVLREPVAVIGNGYAIMWVGGEPIADIVNRHGITVGTKLYAAPVAVAPSDANGKADAANAGGLTVLPGCLADRLYEAISIARDRAEHAGSTPRIRKWDATASDLRAALTHSPATSAANTKDAARYRWLRGANWDDITSLYWSPQVQHAGTPEDCMLKLDEAIDAAMAATPSSAAGKEGGNHG